MFNELDQEIGTRVCKQSYQTKKNSVFSVIWVVQFGNISLFFLRMQPTKVNNTNLNTDYTSHNMFDIMYLIRKRNY